MYGIIYLALADLHGKCIVIHIPYMDAIWEMNRTLHQKKV